MCSDWRRRSGRRSSRPIYLPCSTGRARRVVAVLAARAGSRQRAARSCSRWIGSLRWRAPGGSSAGLVGPPAPLFGRALRAELAAFARRASRCCVFNCRRRPVRVRGLRGPARAACRPRRRAAAAARCCGGRRRRDRSAAACFRRFGSSELPGIAVSRWHLTPGGGRERRRQLGHRTEHGRGRDRDRVSSSTHGGGRRGRARRALPPALPRARRRTRARRGSPAPALLVGLAVERGGGVCSRCRCS